MAAQRIAADAAPGSIDALLARYFLGSTPVPGLGQDSSRLSAAWLEENHDRLWQTPGHRRRSATVSLAPFPACRPVPAACSSPACSGLWAATRSPTGSPSSTISPS